MNPFPTRSTEGESPACGWLRLTRLPSLRDAALGVRHHHERFDGTGYPDALEGEAIPLEARIVAVADAYSAITAGRAYQPALSHDDAIAALDNAAGESFDPGVLAALKRSLAARPHDVAA